MKRSRRKMLNRIIKNGNCLYISVECQECPLAGICCICATFYQLKMELKGMTRLTAPISSALIQIEDL